MFKVFKFIFLFLISFSIYAADEVVSKCQIDGGKKNGLCLYKLAKSKDPMFCKVITSAVMQNGQIQKYGNAIQLYPGKEKPLNFFAENGGYYKGIPFKNEYACQINRVPEGWGADD